MKLAAALFTVLALASPAVAQDAPKTVTLTGKVVDAACFMIHPDAASTHSHKECGAACIARGVPLAIANEADNSLYFPAGGNKELVDLLDQRVQVVGTVTEMSDPMELKMPVGTTNQMAVRVDGGYKVVTIQKVTKAPAKRSGR